MSNFVARNVTILDFSNPRHIRLPEVYQPQSCVIQFEHQSLDIGSNCYALRELDKNGVANKVIKNSQGIGVVRVVMESLDDGRFLLIRKAIEYAINLAQSLSHISLYNEIRYTLVFLRFYFTQEDLSYFDPKHRIHLEEAAKRHSAVLRGRKDIGSAYKNKLTNSAFKFAEFLYDGEDLNVFDYGIIHNNDQSNSGTTPLLSQDYELALALRSAIFEGVADLLLNKKALPYPLSVPEALGELKNTIWLGYSPWPGPMSFPRAKDFRERPSKEWFDRVKGAFVSKEQWLDRRDHQSNKNASDHWESIQIRMSAKNHERSDIKRRYAEYAGQCFFDLMLSMTGMNQQPVLDLPWHGGYFVQKAKQGNKTVTLLKSEDQIELERAKGPSICLRSIKNRKGYQPVEVTISNRFLPQFKRYLQVRHYYLNGASDARLFPFTSGLINSRRQALQAAFPEIQRLGARKARAGVSDSILTSTNDPHVASEILQNAPQTLIKHYAAGTQKAHIQGVGGFFNELGNQIKVARFSTENGIETAVGSCDKRGAQPDPLPDAPLDVNCTQQEGCFFCKHYCVHADETDVRKLVSVLYYINKGATRAHDINFFNELFELVIKRIKTLLENISGISEQKKALVTRIQEEVFTEEALDDYWLAKLNRLEMLVGEY